MEKNPEKLIQHARLLESSEYASVQNRVAGMFINFDEKFPDFKTLFYLLMPAVLFGPALLFGTLEQVHRRSFNYAYFMSYGY